MDQNAVWSLKLNGESWLSVRPPLPITKDEAVAKRLVAMGRSLAAVSGTGSATIIEGDFS